MCIRDSYCWVYAAAGSLVERQDQVQSLAFPLSLPIVFGYIMAITTVASGNASLLFKVLSYLPPTAPFAMPVMVCLLYTSVESRAGVGRGRVGRDGRGLGRSRRRPPPAG